MRTVVVGGGPAGLAAGYRLAHSGRPTLLLEREATLGGLSASFQQDGLVLDQGPHRLHTAVRPDILADLRRLLGDELEIRPRRGLIRLDGRFFPYPLRVASLPRLGAGRLLTLMMGVLTARLSRSAHRSFTYEEVLINRLGVPLYQLLYGPYARKVWGLPGAQIAADQAERRVNQRGIVDLARLALGLAGGGTYLYPRRGFGRIAHAYADSLQAMPEADMVFPAEVQSVKWTGTHVQSVRFAASGRQTEAGTDHLVWTAPIAALIRRLDPPPPTEIRAAVTRLRTRAVVLCYVCLSVPQVGRADTYYFPESRFPFNRVTEQKNFSSDMVPSVSTVLCLDLACDPEDPVFFCSDEQLRDLVLPGLVEAGLVRPQQVTRVFSRRIRQVYPIYDLTYRASLRPTLDWLSHLPNLWLIGRHGLFLHDNVHQSLLMGYRAADAVHTGDRVGWTDALSQFATFRVAD